MIKLVMNKKQEAILAAIILVAVVAIFVLYTGIGRPPAPETGDEAEPGPPPLFDTVTEQKQDHDRTDAGILELLQSGGYTPENPLVFLDPYGTSPLTALLVFQTEEPSVVLVHGPGKTPEVTVSYQSNGSVMHGSISGLTEQYQPDGYVTDHIVPIYGLYPDAVNLIEVFVYPQEPKHDNDFTRIDLAIETGALPEGFPGSLIQQQPGQSAWLPPFYFTFVKKSAYDTNGDCRWLYNGYETQYPSAYTSNGNALIIVGSIEDGDALLLEVNMLGKIVSLVPYESANKFDGHDANHFERRGLYN